MEPTTRSLPPLILHPFAEANTPSKLMDSSRASMMLQGIIPSGTHSYEDLDRSLIEGRYCEIRMLFYVGRDLRRWIEQCTETFAGEKYASQSFAALLVGATPVAVQEKLREWGVTDYRSIFGRALGLNALFSEMPERGVLSDEFVRNYYRYADQLFACQQNQVRHANLSQLGFEFEIYASGEYTRMLEKSWQESS